MSKLPGLQPRRKAAKMSRAELGRRLHVSGQAVGQWEAGQTVPAADRLPEIARILGCSINDLYRLETEQTKKEEESDK